MIELTYKIKLQTFAQVIPQLLVDYQTVMLEASCYNQAPCRFETRFFQNDIWDPPVTEGLLAQIVESLLHNDTKNSQ
jgi:hypothetical protein